MGICRVVYKLNGQVSVIHPAFKSKRPDESDQEFTDRVFAKCAKEAGLDGLPYDDVDTATLPDRVDREKWRGSKGVGVSVDNTIITLADKRKAKEDALDLELAKPAPNPITAMRLQRELDKGIL